MTDSPNTKNLEPLLDLMTAYQRSRVLLTFVELDISKILNKEKLSAPDVERDENVYAGWLREVGFENIECRTYLAPTKMLCGFKL